MDESSWPNESESFNSRQLSSNSRSRLASGNKRRGSHKVRQRMEALFKPMSIIIGWPKDEKQCSFCFHVALWKFWKLPILFATESILNLAT